MNAVRLDINPDSSSARFVAIARRLTVGIVALASTASVAALLFPVLYRETAMAPAMRGQDLVTLIATMALGATIPVVRRASVRASLIWIGLLAYVLYAFTGAAFAYRFNELFLLYVALFALATFALALATASIDVPRVAKSFDAKTPRAPVAAFLVGVALMLGVSELSAIVGAQIAGTVPDLLVRSEGAGNFVYALDLGLVMPLALMGAALLMRRSGWGYVLAGTFLIKAITMGLALLSATWFGVRAGMPLELVLTVAYGAIAFGAIGMSIWFFRHCNN